MREAPESERSGNIIGIHLGTTTTRVARFNETGKPEVTNNSEGNSSTPSVIQIDDSGTVIVGTEAKKFIGTATPNVFAEFKRDMGTDKSWPVGGKHVTPVDLCALLLKKVVADYAEQFGQPQSVTITWPANYRDEQREATKEAVALAGLRGVSFIDETTAAALYYSSHRTLEGKYLIVDYSEGKLEVTLFEAHGSNIQVLHQDGVRQLGERDLRGALLKIIGVKYFERTGDEFDAIDCNFDKLAVEDAKHTLSIKDKTSIRLVSSKHGPVPIYITRHEFEVGIRHLVAQAEMACENVLRCGNDYPGGLVKKSEIEAVFMTGDLGYIPAFRLSILRQFGKTPIVEYPEHAIALGAATYAAHRYAGGTLNPMNNQILSTPRINDVSPCFVGIVFTDWLTNTSINRIIIPKGTAIPCRKKFILTADKHGYLPAIRLTQSTVEEHNPDFVSEISHVDVPRGQAHGAHELTLGYDENGVLFCKIIRNSDQMTIRVDLNRQ